jgi:predicted hotdog family 3-hydroxylacyl-ACP dehydratase
MGVVYTRGAVAEAPGYSLLAQAITLQPVTRLSHDAIAALIPHHGAMCLLEEVLSWDAREITCRASNHRNPGNPLREHDVLHAICGVEYAAQAMAVHGALVHGSAMRRGVLASVREVSMRVQRLDDIAEDLVVTARTLLGDEAHLLYEFTIAAGEREILQGRAAVVLLER